MFRQWVFLRKEKVQSKKLLRKEQNSHSEPSQRLRPQKNGDFQIKPPVLSGMGRRFLTKQCKRMYFSKPEKYQNGFLSGTTFPTPSSYTLARTETSKGYSGSAGENRKFRSHPPLARQHPVVSIKGTPPFPLFHSSHICGTIIKTDKRPRRLPALLDDRPQTAPARAVVSHLPPDRKVIKGKNSFM